MLRLLSQQQAFSLRGTIPELAPIRSLQFQGEGYDPDIHGVILVLNPGDDPAEIPGIGLLMINTVGHFSLQGLL
jgi:hypothetical protein